MAGNEEEKAVTDCAGLHKEWEQELTIRKHFRAEGAVLFTADTADNIKTASKPMVKDFLTPILYRMAATEGQPQPLVEHLRDELRDLYKTFHISPDDDQIVLDSWATRKFLTFIKMKTRKKMPSGVLWPKT